MLGRRVDAGADMGHAQRVLEAVLTTRRGRFDARNLGTNARMPFTAPRTSTPELASGPEGAWEESWFRRLRAAETPASQGAAR